MTTAYLALLVASLAGAVITLLREAERHRPIEDLDNDASTEIASAAAVEPVKKAA